MTFPLLVGQVVSRLPAPYAAPATMRDLALAFHTMFATRDTNALRPWLDAARCGELRTFAVGLERDPDAVLAVIPFRWSNGQVEGQVNRLNCSSAKATDGWDSRYCANGSAAPRNTADATTRAHAIASSKVWKSLFTHALPLDPGGDARATQKNRTSVSGVSVHRTSARSTRY